MAYYKTCVGCLFEKAPCRERQNMSEKIAGLGITSVKFRCGWKRPAFNPGQPVWVRIVIDWDEDYWDAKPITATFPGYFSQSTQSGLKHIVFIPAGTMDRKGEEEFTPKGNGYCKIPRAYVWRRDDAVPASFCRDCGQLSDVQGHQEYCRQTPEGMAYFNELSEVRF